LTGVDVIGHADDVMARLGDNCQWIETLPDRIDRRHV
jgi:hypothetical protein